MRSEHKINATRFSKVTFSTVLILIDLCFLAVHIFYLICFLVMGVIEMFLFNLVSVAVYALLAPLVYKYSKKLSFFACIVLAEILLHAAMATLYLGWEAGFPMFIVCCAPFPFFLRFKNDIIPFVIELIIIVLFVVIKLNTLQESDVIYTEIKDRCITRLFVFNTLVSFLMITAFSTIYKISRQLDRINMIYKNETLSMMVRIDPLSQLFNRRAMVEFLKKLEKNAKEGKGGFVIVMSDLDDFKHVNDTYGHAAGDMVITTVSRMITEIVPSEGYVCRWGGEEMLFAVPGADSEAGRQLAEKIRRRLERYIFTSSDGSQFSITVTLGVCECDGTISYERAVSIADQYLYYGKSQGKNIVVEKETFPAELLK